MERDREKEGAWDGLGWDGRGDKGDRNQANAPYEVDVCRECGFRP